MHSFSHVLDQASHHGCLLPSPPPFAFTSNTFSLTKPIISSSNLPSPPPSPTSSIPLNSLNLSLLFQPMARVALSSTTCHNRWWHRDSLLSLLLLFSSIDSLSLSLSLSLSFSLFNLGWFLIPVWKSNPSDYPSMRGDRIRWEADGGKIQFESLGAISMDGDIIPQEAELVANRSKRKREDLGLGELWLCVTLLIHSFVMMCNMLMWYTLIGWCKTWVLNHILTKFKL